ncbi:Piezo-type mechanosensitive ion channel component 1 [Saguinus oedipus]|uniref:Piezo-type mechanosensitive ion channel component 1 n=1 Tax=Saguinus oedipus TaxID=9490 RepID=A0ABQ9TLQ6_SAGOE|nr:Piezo-type mechanosensitive ion channel component 1 [Saguinus oedipus]
MTPPTPDYPWRWSRAVPMNSALIKWLYLPDFFRAPNSTNLISVHTSGTWQPAGPALIRMRTDAHTTAPPGAPGHSPGQACVCSPWLYTPPDPGWEAGYMHCAHLVWVPMHLAQQRLPCPAGDFLLLLCASQQWQVFSAERTEEWQRMAGVNTDHLEPLWGEPNPVPNFVHCSLLGGVAGAPAMTLPHGRSYLDMLKVAVFRYLFWLVLVVVFVTGATRISIFGLGYLLACFYLLLFGTALLQRDTQARLVLWDCLILYNVTVIISKNMLSLLACAFVEQMQTGFCWVIQLFSLVCTVKGYYDREWWRRWPRGGCGDAPCSWAPSPTLVGTCLAAKEMMGRDQDCLLPVEEAGIIWDSVCFFFLLLQRRVFLSHYYLHASSGPDAAQRSRLGARKGQGEAPGCLSSRIVESRLHRSVTRRGQQESRFGQVPGAHTLSPPLPRGFALYNAANLKSIDFHRRIEERSLAQLKRQMERIRAKQEKHRQGRVDRGGPKDPGLEPGALMAPAPPGVLTATSHSSCPFTGPDSPGGSSPPRRQWWRPWLDHATVIHSGDYFLFESDSEEEEEAAPEGSRPSTQSAFQVRGGPCLSHLDHRAWGPRPGQHRG